MGLVIHGSADFSPCGYHRYKLDRWWDGGPRVLVCGANPSKATATAMDPTMHRVLALTRQVAAGFTMVNASSYIATDPAAHRRWEEDARYEGDIYRKHRRANLFAIRAASQAAHMRVAAWGNLVEEPPEDLLAALSCDDAYPILCWGTTKDGNPKHPLARGKAFIPKGTIAQEWRTATTIHEEAHFTWHT